MASDSVMNSVVVACAVGRLGFTFEEMQNKRQVAKLVAAELTREGYEGVEVSNRNDGSRNYIVYDNEATLKRSGYSGGLDFVLRPRSKK